MIKLTYIILAPYQAHSKGKDDSQMFLFPELLDLIVFKWE